MNRFQRGVSLISLMIGILISTCIVLTLLVFYKNLVAVSINASRIAAQEGQLSTGMMTLQLAVQSAGYGLVPGNNSHVSINKISLEGVENSLVWRYLDNAKMHCQGVAEKTITDTETGLKSRRVVSIMSQACPTSQPLELAAWEEDAPLFEFKNREAQAMNISLGKKKCSPFGFTSTSETHQVVEISVPVGATNELTETRISQSVCLINTQIQD